MILFLLLLLCIPSLASSENEPFVPITENLSTLPTLQRHLGVANPPPSGPHGEDAARFAEQFGQDMVASGGLHPASGSCVSSAFSTIAYTQSGNRIAQPSAAIPYNTLGCNCGAGSDTAFVIASSSPLASLGNFQRVAGTNYFVNCTDSTFSLPADSAALMQVNISNGTLATPVDIAKRSLIAPAAQEIVGTTIGAFSNGYVHSGCAPLAGAGPLALNFASCDAFVLSAPAELKRVIMSAPQEVVFNNGSGVYWLVFHESASLTLAGWTRQGSMLWQRVDTRPALPDGAVWVRQVTVTAGAISASLDLRSSNPFGINLLRVTDNLFGASATGTTDDSPAFRRMFATAKRGNVEMKVPAGRYLIDGDAIDPPSTNTSITLVDVANATLDLSGATLLQGPSSIRLLGLFHSINIKIVGLNCVGHTQIISDQKHCLVIGHNSDRIEVDSMYCTNFLGDCVAVGGNFANGSLLAIHLQISIYTTVCLRSAMAME